MLYSRHVMQGRTAKGKAGQRKGKARQRKCKKDSEQVKEDSEKVKKDSEKVKQDSEKVKQDSEHVWQDSEQERVGVSLNWEQPKNAAIFSYEQLTCKKHMQQMSLSHC